MKKGQQIWVLISLHALHVLTKKLLGTQRKETQFSFPLFLLNCYGHLLYGMTLVPSLGPSVSRGMLREEHDLHDGQEDRGSLVPLLSAYSGAFEFMGLLDISNVITFIKPRSLNRRVFVQVIRWGMAMKILGTDILVAHAAWCNT